MCLHLLGCSSLLPLLLSTHHSMIWCDLSPKVCHKLCRVLFMLHISFCLSFTLILSLFISFLSLFPLPLLPLYRLFSAFSHWPPCFFSFSAFKTNCVSLINLLHSFILLRTSTFLPSSSTFSLRFLIVKHPSHIQSSLSLSLFTAECKPHVQWLMTGTILPSECPVFHTKVDTKIKRWTLPASTIKQFYRKSCKQKKAIWVWWW